MKQITQTFDSESYTPTKDQPIYTEIKTFKN